MSSETLSRTGKLNEPMEVVCTPGSPSAGILRIDVIKRPTNEEQTVQLPNLRGYVVLRDTGATGAGPA